MEMDINKFKQLVTDLYQRETRPAPNFNLIKNAYDYIDLRKDGVIDINEWQKTFSITEVK